MSQAQKDAASSAQMQQMQQMQQQMQMQMSMQMQGAMQQAAAMQSQLAANAAGGNQARGGMMQGQMLPGMMQQPFMPSVGPMPMQLQMQMQLQGNAGQMPLMANPQMLQQMQQQLQGASGQPVDATNAAAAVGQLTPQQMAMMGGMMPMGMMNSQAQQQMAMNAQAQKQANIGPKTTLVNECSVHKGSKILFELCSEDDGQVLEGTEEKSAGKTFCEKCYQEESKRLKEQRDKKKESQSAKGDLPVTDLIKKLQEPAEPLNMAELPEKAEKELSPQEEVVDLHKKIETLCQQLSYKIEKKNEGLILNHEHFGLYETTLNEKYNPVFLQMRQLLQEKREEYTNFLNTQLTKNDERIQREHKALEKLSESLQSIQDGFKQELEHELVTIKSKETLQKKEQDQAKEGEGAEGEAKPEVKATDAEKDSEANAADEEVRESKVDSYKISALFTMLDDFENILNKNFCLFANYEDFSFAQSRSTENLAQEFTSFFDYHFQGDFRVKNWFHKNVLPRIYHPQQGSKFIHCFKILNNISQCVLLQNLFPVPERTRCIVSPTGQCYQIGGFLPNLNLFMRNTFVLDEHRSQLVALSNMHQGRSDHSLLMFSDHDIYVFGGMGPVSIKPGSAEPGMLVKSLNTCEVYSIKEDKWTSLQPFSHARQQFSVCHFNERFIFLFGGKCLKQGKARAGGPEPYDFVEPVEVYEIDKKVWRTINYISEPKRLAVLSAGSAQIAGSQILIFGGLIPSENAIQSQTESLEEEEEKPRRYGHQQPESQEFVDNGRDLTLTKQTLILDVTVGSIKHGPELNTPSYFISGGYKLTHNNMIYAFGLGMPPSYLQANSAIVTGLSALGGSQAAASDDKKPAAQEFVIGATQHKKLLHCYRVADTKWTETNEAIFSGQRKESDLGDEQ